MTMPPLVRHLQELVRADGRSLSAIERKAGVGKDTFLRWFHGHPRSGGTGTLGPSLLMFECVLNTLGYELTIRKRGREP